MLLATWARVVVVLVAIFSPVLTISLECGVCEESRCPELHYCEGQVVKDHCGCCTVCSNSRYQPHPLITSAQRQGSACEQVQCPKFKVCVENMQGLPLCTCPSEYICRRHKLRPLCSTDGRTYQSRCHMRITACNSGAKLKVRQKGPCPASPGGGEGSEAKADTGGSSVATRPCDSASTCRRRRQRTVCGSDGRTYASRCHMKIEACQQNVKIKLRHAGGCAYVRSEDPSSGAVSQTSDVNSAVKTDVSRGSGGRGGVRKKNEASSDNEDAEEEEKEETGDDSVNGGGKRRRRNRKKRKDSRRKRRKTRVKPRGRRHKMLKDRFQRAFGHYTWKF